MSEVLRQEQLAVIREVRPEAQNIQALGAGDINSVVLVDNEVFRFPIKSDGGQTLQYEAAILGRLAGKTTLQIPGVHAVADYGAYTVLSYVPGKMLTSEEIMAFTDGEKRQLSQGIASFMGELNKALSVDETARLQSKYIPWLEDEHTYYETKLQWGEGTRLHDLYAQYYEAFKRQLSKVATSELVLFGDFHYGNMLFNDAHDLTGIIDFGDCGPGTIYNELRQLYRLGEDIVHCTIEALNNRFGEVDMEAVRLNAIMHELAVLMRPESQAPTQSQRADLAHRLLTQWVGQDWEQ
jgi:hypothetical protein